MYLMYGRLPPGSLRLAVVLLFLSTPFIAPGQSPSSALQAERSSLETRAGVVSGTVTDLDGAVIEGAHITLSITSAPVLKTVSAADGSFSFDAIASGEFKLTIASEGFATKLITGTLQPDKPYEVPLIELTAATNVDVEVTLSQHDLAIVEVKAEEQQRLAGFLPNFFVTYDWHAAPLSSKQKFELAWRTTLDPATLIVNGAVAGVQQAQNDFSGYGQGAQGYGKRYGAAFADTVTGNFLGGAILPSLLHQDPRYFYLGRGSIPKRAGYALAAAVICRGDNGKWQPNYSSILGDLAAGGISNLYYPAADRNGASLTIENGVLGIVGDAVGNVIQEFVFRKITPHLPRSNSNTP
ncbi:carboxypeptidase-like regulatory domain-containing protein [Granulicella arctica]|uniref:carboxypeptidase-like regulatory domain-containing protein n=1 Tax=Granulicella arctica TaxID=940613 RepID=UPI0021DF7F6B|nr:carboxypeptidase-like regulatory domain-containing protein [Granulicella arctica]